MIYCEDCLTTLDRFEDNYLDLIVTSPPYNVGLKYDGYSDVMNYDDYLEWIEVVFKRIYQKTKSGGRCCINVGDQKNGQISLHSDIINLMNNIGWLNFTLIIWDKGHTNNRTAWGSYLSPSCPSFPRGFEYILVFAKTSLKLSSKGQTDLERQEFIDWSYGHWKIKPETKQIKHPAPFPIEIPKRLIKMLSWKSAVVYDPFSGSGTTAVACKETNRIFIGSEISQEYVNDSLSRLSNHKTIKNKTNDLF